MSERIPPHVLARTHQLVDELARARGLLGWSQRDLSRRACVTQGTVSELERHVADPKLSTYLRLADATGVLPGDDLGHLPLPKRTTVRVQRRVNALYVARVSGPRRLNQRQVALALGTQQSCISDWERGEVVPVLSSYLRFAEVVGVDV